MHVRTHAVDDAAKAWRPARLRVRLAAAALALCALFIGLDARTASTARPEASPAATALRARYAELQDRLRDNAFGLALYVDSRQQPEHLAGDLYGVINQPFAEVRATLADRPHWCELLLLHINVKDCRASSVQQHDGIVLQLGGKNDVGGENDARLAYRFTVDAATSDYLGIVLAADTGPYGTTDHRIALEATGLPDNRTFIHLAYSHSYGTVARLALAAYLNTVGRDKVGFTVVSRTANDQPVYVKGVRGIVERNCMRYFLAVIAYLRGNAAPPDQRVERRLSDWFDLTERYPQQLHEVTRAQYFDTKLQEFRRFGARAVLGPTSGAR